MTDDTQLDDGAEEDLDLASLSDDELVQQMHDDLYDGLKEEIEEGTNILLGHWLDAGACSERCTCRRYAHRRHRLPDGILFVPEV